MFTVLFAIVVYSPYTFSCQ